jgi:hypothetical protein
MVLGQTSRCTIPRELPSHLYRLPSEATPEVNHRENVLKFLYDRGTGFLIIDPGLSGQTESVEWQTGQKHWSANQDKNDRQTTV